MWCVFVVSVVEELQDAHKLSRHLFVSNDSVEDLHEAPVGTAGGCNLCS